VCNQAATVIATAVCAVKAVWLHPAKQQPRFGMVRQRCVTSCEQTAAGEHRFGCCSRMMQSSLAAHSNCCIPTLLVAVAVAAVVAAAAVAAAAVQACLRSHPLGHRCCSVASAALQHCCCCCWALRLTLEVNRAGHRARQNDYGDCTYVIEQELSWVAVGTSSPPGHMPIIRVLPCIYVEESRRSSCQTPAYAY
jgi:hypothetical protein